MEDVAARVSHKKRDQPVLIRYADDFLIFHPSKEILDKATEAVTAWLKERGLVLSAQKTRITHTLTP
jgi:RNA-directed DNA polymerase